MNHWVTKYAVFAALCCRVVCAIDWNECVDLARRQNPELGAAQNVLNASSYAARGAYAGFFPQLSGSLGFQRDGTPVTTTNGYSAGLNVQMNLFTGLADRAKVIVARAKRDTAEADLTIMRAKVSYELKTAFAALQFAQESTKLSEAIIERRQANLKLVRLRFQSGLENRGSLMLSETNLESAQVDALAARTGLEAAKTELARVLGLDAGGELVVTGGVPESVPPSDITYKTLVNDQPEVLRAEAVRRETEAGITAARSAFFPALNVSGGVGNGGSEFFPSDNPHWMVGVGIVIPLFNGGTDYYAAKSASENAKASALRSENINRRVMTTLRQTIANYAVAVRKLETDRHFVEASRVRSLIGREKYNDSLITFEDWDLIENDYISRQKTLLTSSRDRVVAEAAWEQARGTGVFK